MSAERKPVAPDAVIYADRIDVVSALRRWKHELCGTGTEELHGSELAVTKAIDALRDVDHVITTWRESGREPAYGQWLTLQDLVRDALDAVTGAASHV